MPAAETEALLYAFNRGVISNLALARTDLKQQALSAQVQTNWMPRELGSMMLRPGFGFIDNSYNNNKAVYIPFIKKVSDTALIELTDMNMRVRINEQIVSRVAVGTTITNPNFTSNINGWDDGDESGATSQWVAGPFMSLTGNGTGSRAIRSQAVAVAGGDRGVEHALRVVISKGYVTLRVGTTLGDDSYINNITLSPGTYSLAFTPTTNFVIQLDANAAYASYVSSVNIEAAGPMVVPAPWALADLQNIRSDQSQDEIFLSCIGYKQYKIERIGNKRSWAVLLYRSDDGPFQLINTDLSILMAPGALNGDTTLNSSIPYFKPGHVGCLFRVTSNSQNTSDVIAGPNQASEFIEVTDVGANRTFSFQITGTWVGTIHLERSVGTPGTWISVGTYTSNQNTTFNDGLDNQIIYYRFSFEANYTSGSAGIAMQFSGGGITGICRVTGYNSSTSVTVEVLKSFGSAGGVTTYASGNISFGSTNPSNGDTITLNGVTWTFVTSGATGDQTNIKGSLAATLIQLASDLNASSDPSLTVASYVAASTQLDISYNTSGTAGNAYTLAASAGTPSAATLTGGSSTPSTNAVSTWSEGEWSDLNGYPSANCFYEGRLWWFGNDRIDGSVSDAFASFDDTIDGDSGPILRSIGSGPVEDICWALALLRLLVGGENREFSVASSYLNEAITPTNNNIKSPSSRGSCKVAGVQVDTNGLFVQRGDPDSNNESGTRLIEMAYQGTYAPVDYTSKDLSLLAPEVVQVGILKIAVQRKIDTRIHCVLADGTVAVLVYDPVENVKAWIPIKTDGLIEDVVILPGAIEDKVYYSVARVINGATVRYLEKWALESECVGGNLNKQGDSFSIIANVSPSTAISVPHLAGKQVVVWADGIDVGTQTVNGVRSQIYTLDASGNATLAAPALNVMVGLYYEALFRSTKLAYAAQEGAQALTHAKSIGRLGVIIANTHAQGLRYGRDFNHLDNLPMVVEGKPATLDQIWGEYDHQPFTFPGTWNTDSRLCLKAAAPRPANVMAAVIEMSTSS